MDFQKEIFSGDCSVNSLTSVANPASHCVNAELCHPRIEAEGKLEW